MIRLIFRAATLLRHYYACFAADATFFSILTLRLSHYAAALLLLDATRYYMLRYYDATFRRCLMPLAERLRHADDAFAAAIELLALSAIADADARHAIDAAAFRYIR